MDEEMVEVLVKGALLTGPPGSGKTSLLTSAFTQLVQDDSRADWAPALYLTPDRRRARDTESLLSPRTLGGVSAIGGHRVVRSVSSYAYLVISEWLVGRDVPLPRPALTSGAEEDAWFSEWLEDHPEAWQGLVPDQVVSTEWFRGEIRNLLARAGEHGLNPEDLRRLGDAADIPEWVVLAQMYQDYAGPDPFSPLTPHLDAARVQIIASQVLRQWHQSASAEGVKVSAPIPRHVIADDLQDCTRASVALLEALHECGAVVIGATTPLAGTASYRGADPHVGDLVASACHLDRIPMDRNLRAQTPQLHGLVQGVQQLLQSPQTTVGSATPVRVFSSSGRQAGFIAADIRRRHFMEGTPWEQHAVIVRHSGDIQGVYRQLSRHGVAMAPAQRPVRLAAVPVCRTILTLIHPPETEDQQAADFSLVTSPLVEADPLQLYRFLREAQGQLGPEAGILSYWLGAAEIPQPLQESFSDTTQSLLRARQLRRAGQAARGLPAEQGLWQVWNTAGVAEQWRERALRGGPSGSQADARLDSVVALFRTADLWMQKALDSDSPTTADAFAAELLDQDVERDSLAQMGRRAPGVEVVTVAQAAGRQWDHTYVMGLQDGAWPTSPREGSLLQLPRLTALMEVAWQGSSVSLDLLDSHTLRTPPDYASIRREHTRNEAMLLLSAVSRARLSATIVTVCDSDQALSPFLTLLRDRGVVGWETDSSGFPAPDESILPFALETVVAQLRRDTMSSQPDAEIRTRSAQALAYLARNGVSSANPELWVNAGSRTTTGEIGGNDPFHLSPSRLQTASDCLLRWFFQAIHAEKQPGIFASAAPDSAAIGTLIHQVAEELPQGNAQQLRERFEQLWEQQELGDGSWLSDREKERALVMVSRLGDYFQTPLREVSVEDSVFLDLGSALVTGRIDRLETLPTGEQRIVDIKTGNTKPKASDVLTNLQLATYQLAIGNFEDSAGAVYLSVGAPGAKEGPVFVQPPLTREDAELLTSQLSDLSAKMRGPDYRPTECSACRICQFASMCPLKEDS